MKKLVAFALLGALAGCGGPSCPSGTEARGDGCVEVRPDGGGGMDDGGADAGARDAGADDAGEAPLDAGCTPGAPDPIGLDDVDEDCDGVDGVDAEQWYVSPTGDDTNVGSRAAPFATVARALGATPRRPILVAVGTYASPALGGYEPILEGAVALHGGYDPVTWRRTSARSVLRLPQEGAQLVLRGADAALVLERVELIAADAAVDRPLASQALFLRGDDTGEVLPRVVLRESVVRAGSARRGADGASGMMRVGVSARPGQAGTPGRPCNFVAGGECGTGPVSGTTTPITSGTCFMTVASGGDGGGSGLPGASSAAGRGGGGVVISGEGGAGESGADGATGADGRAGAALGAFRVFPIGTSWPGGGVYYADPGENGANGAPGEGGGGGAGGFSGTNPASTCATGDRRATSTLSGGSGGSGGDGGCPGYGGERGAPGGPSIAVVARGVVVQLERSTIATGGGGRGGDGGNGSPGAEGGQGGQVNEFACLQSNSRRGYRGGPGGDGGRGGDGGAGAGGPGGPSIGIALLAGASVERDAASRFELGPPGAGGASAGNRGADGVRAETQMMAEVP